MHFDAIVNLFDPLSLITFVLTLQGSKVLKVLCLCTNRNCRFEDLSRIQTDFGITTMILDAAILLCSH
jgi:hypothetical protein